MVMHIVAYACHCRSIPYAVWKSKVESEKSLAINALLTLFFVLRPVATPYLPRRSHGISVCVCVHDVKCIDWCEQICIRVYDGEETEFRYQVYSFFPSQDGNTLAAPNLHSSFITEVVKHNLINIYCTELVSEDEISADRCAARSSISVVLLRRFRFFPAQKAEIDNFIFLTAWIKSRQIAMELHWTRVRAKWKIEWINWLVWSNPLKTEYKTLCCAFLFHLLRRRCVTHRSAQDVARQAAYCCFDRCTVPFSFQRGRHLDSVWVTVPFTMSYLALIKYA